MSAYNMLSTNETLTAATNWSAVESTTGVYTYVEVVNLSGSATVTYKIGRAAIANPTSQAVNTWILPAAAGASRAHQLAEPNKDPAAGLFVDVISGGTPHVLVTAW